MYTKGIRHRCKFKCTKCQKYTCEKSNEGRMQKIRCSECNVMFDFKKCYEQHKTKPSDRKRSICQKYHVCAICQKYHHVNLSIPHLCGTTYCHICSSYQLPTHNCCWIPPTNATKLVEDQQKFEAVVFDLECQVVDENGVDLDFHIPNMLVYQSFCANCLDPDFCCAKCETKKGVLHTLDDADRDILDEFITMLLTESKYDGNIILAHNGSRYDNIILLPALLKKTLPKVIKKGNQIIVMKVEKTKNFNKLTFKDSYLSIPVSIAKLAKAFGFEGSKGIFPHLYNIPKNYNIQLNTLPPINYYNPENMSKEERLKFESWYTENFNQPFNFKAELMKYCEKDVWITVRSLKVFINMNIKMDGFNPIFQCNTFAAYSMFLIKHLHMKMNQVGYIPENGFGQYENQSMLAIGYIKWLIEKEGKDLMYKLNGGEKRISVASGSTFRVDAYEPTTQTVYEVLGCVYHGCILDQNPENAAPYDPKLTQGHLYASTMSRISQIERAGYSVVQIWEHTIRERMKKEEEFRKFIKMNQHTSRLNPRDSMFGGRVEIFSVKAEKKNGYRIRYLDFTSLYPYVNGYEGEYPKGQPTVITKNFEYPTSTRKLIYRGLVYCDILPPTDLKIPVLPMRWNDKIFFTLCRSCVMNKKNVGNCEHNKITERYFTSTICHNELTIALDRGYKILKIHEVYHWENWEKGGLFRDFIASKMVIKQQASGWPKQNMSEDEKQAYIDYNMEKNNIKLNPSEVEHNPALRYIAKLQLNSAWGKFIESSDHSTTVFVTANDQMFDYENNTDYEITDITLLPAKLNDDVIYMYTFRLVQEKQRSCKFTNIPIGSYTTSTARMLLLKALEKVGRQNLIYSDTDSILFYEDISSPQLETGESIGELTDEIESGWSITKVLCLAPKFYSYKIENNVTGETKEVLKSKGIRCDSTTMNNLSMDQLEQMIDMNKTVKLSQLMFIKSTTSVRTTTVDKIVKPIYDKIIVNDDLTTTIPLGYLNDSSLIYDYPYFQ